MSFHAVIIVFNLLILLLGTSALFAIDWVGYDLLSKEKKKGETEIQ